MISKERIGNLFKGVGMAEFMDCLVLAGHTEEGYVRIKPNLQMVRRKIRVQELEQLERYVDKDYIKWYRLWVVPKDKEELESKVIGIGEYYQEYIQSKIGMAPDLVRKDSYKIVGEIAAKVKELRGEELGVGEYLKLTLLENTTIPKQYGNLFKKGLGRGSTDMSHKYVEAYNAIMTGGEIDYRGLDIFSLLYKLESEGIKDPTWLSKFLGSSRFESRTINQTKAQEAIIEEIQNTGLVEEECMRVEQILEDYKKLKEREPKIQVINPLKIGKDTIKWEIVGRERYILTTFGEKRIVGYEKGDRKKIHINSKKYALSLKEMAEEINKMKTIVGPQAVIVSILISKSRVRKEVN